MLLLHFAIQSLFFLQDVVSGTVIANDSLLQALGLNDDLDAGESSTGQKVAKGKDDKVWEILNRIPNSQDGRGDAKGAPSAVYLQKPGDPSKYILLMGDQTQSELILNKDGTFSTAIKVEGGNDDDIQVLSHTKKQSLFGFMNSTPAKHKKKPGRPRKQVVQQQQQLQQQMQSQSFMLDDTTNDSHADDPSSSGRRRRSKLPSKWNDYIVENFDEAITSGGAKPKLGKFSESEIDLSGDSNFEESLSAAFEDDDDDDILPDGTSRKANKSSLKMPKATLIQLGDTSTPGATPEMWKFPSTKKRGRPRKFEPQRHIIVQNSPASTFTSPLGVKSEFRQRTLTVTPIFKTNTVLSRPIAPRPEPGMKTLLTGSGERILVSESADETSMLLDTDGGNSSLDASINYRELIQDPNFSPKKTSSTPRKVFQFNSDVFHRMPSTRGRGGIAGMKRRPGRPRKEDQLSRLTNGG